MDEQKVAEVKAVCNAINLLVENGYMVESREGIIIMKTVLANYQIATDKGIIRIHQTLEEAALDFAKSCGEALFE